MNKKLGAILLTVCMSLSMVACGGKTENTASEPESVQSEKEETPKEEPISEAVTPAEDSGKESAEQNNDSEPEENTNQESSANLSIDEEYANLADSEGFVFESNGDGSCTLTAMGVCSDSIIVIPAESPAGDAVTEIGENAFYDAEDIEAIIFAGKTMEIDTQAFSSCEVEKLVITGSELTIGENAFSYCEDMQSLVISNSVVEIDEYAFYDAGKDMDAQMRNSTLTLNENAFQSSAIGALKITDCITTADENAFSYCEDITSIEITNGSAAIGGYAFYDTGDNMTVTMTGCELTLEDNAFQSCKMVSAAITDCPTEIGENAFSYCEDLESFTIGKGTIEIGSYAFYDCANLKTVNIGGEEDSENNIITIEDNAFQTSGIENVVIAGGTIEIGNNGFAYCENLMNVSIGACSLSVGEYAFYDCPAELVITYDGVAYNKESIEKVK